MRHLPSEPAVVVPGGELGQVPGDPRLPRLLGLGVAVSVGGEQQRDQRHRPQVVRAGPEGRTPRPAGTGWSCAGRRAGRRPPPGDQAPPSGRTASMSPSPICAHTSQRAAIRRRARSSRRGPRAVAGEVEGGLLLPPCTAAPRAGRRHRRSASPRRWPRAARSRSAAAPSGLHGRGQPGGQPGRPPARACDRQPRIRRRCGSGGHGRARRRPRRRRPAGPVLAGPRPRPGWAGRWRGGRLRGRCRSMARQRSGRSGVCAGHGVVR